MLGRTSPEWKKKDHPPRSRAKRPVNSMSRVHVDVGAGKRHENPT